MGGATWRPKPTVSDVFDRVQPSFVPRRAQEKYQEALQLFVGALGNNHNLVLDLEQRIQEVQAFMDN